MKTVNKNNRYYCHRKLKSGRLNVRKRTIYIQYRQFEDSGLDKYAERLRDTYNYSIQTHL